MITTLTRQDLQHRVEAARHQLPPGDRTAARALDTFSWQLDHHPGATVGDIQAEGALRLTEAQSERRLGIALQVAGYTAMAVGWVALVAVPVPVMITPVALGCATCIWGAVEQDTGRARAREEEAFLAELDRFTKVDTVG